MADIKVAATWLREGKKVRRASWNEGFYLRERPSGFLNDDRGQNADWLMVEDLLSDDWQEFIWAN
jgi:hypothetical protein